jgi:hypothetical protein
MINFVRNTERGTFPAVEERDRWARRVARCFWLLLTKMKKMIKMCSDKNAIIKMCFLVK